MREHDCLWDEWMYLESAMGEHLDEMLWAVELSCQWDSETLLPSSGLQIIHFYNNPRDGTDSP